MKLSKSEKGQIEQFFSDKFCFVQLRRMGDKYAVEVERTGDKFRISVHRKINEGLYTTTLNYFVKANDASDILKELQELDYEW